MEAIRTSSIELKDILGLAFHLLERQDRNGIHIDSPNHRTLLNRGPLEKFGLFCGKCSMLRTSTRFKAIFVSLSLESVWILRLLYMPQSYALRSFCEIHCGARAQQHLIQCFFPFAWHLELFFQTMDFSSLNN